MHSTALLLLRRGADPNASSCPMPVLFFAVRSGDIEMVRLLLLKGAKAGVTLPDSVCTCDFRNWLVCGFCFFNVLLYCTSIYCTYLLIYCEFIDKIQF